MALPVRLIGGPGQAHDVTRGCALIDGFEPGSVIADKGYDADRLIEVVRVSGATTVIPSRRNRKVARGFDRDVYKGRNQIERFLNKLKQFRRVATRHDKLLANYMVSCAPLPDLLPQSLEWPLLARKRPLHGWSGGRIQDFQTENAALATWLKTAEDEAKRVQAHLQKIENQLDRFRAEEFWDRVIHG